MSMVRQHDDGEWVKRADHDAEVERLQARELNALRLLLMAQHNWDWSVVCDIDIDRARDMTRTSAPFTDVGAETEDGT